MIDDKLSNYINLERARGLSDELLRAELIRAGWREADVATALLSNIATSPSYPLHNVSSSTEDLSRVGLYFLLPGVLLFLAASSVVVATYTTPDLVTPDKRKIMFGIFVLAHAFNALAAFLFFHSAWRLSHSVFYKFWIGLLAVPVALFAVSSFAHFLSLSTRADFFEILERGFMLMGEGDGLSLVIYFVLLPLQAVVFLALLVTCWVLRFRRRRAVDKLLPRTSLTTGLLIFFVMAILALVDLGFILNGSGF